MNLSFLPPWFPTIKALKASKRPVIVNTFKVKKTDAEKLRDAKCRQLAEEIGWCWPTYQRPKELGDILEEEIDAALARDPTFMSHGGLT